MSHEYNYIRHPTHFRVLWGVLYGILAILFLIGLYLIVGRIRTHNLPSGQVELSVPYSKYLVGEKINFTVKNNFNSTIYSINHCPDEPLGIYKLINGTWQRIHAKANKDCSDDDRKISIPAHSSTTASLAPWQSLFDEAGKYRLVVFVEYYNALPYQDIEIINKPKPANLTNSSSTNNNITNANGTNSNSIDTDGDEDDNGSENVNPVAYTIHVNSSGIYDSTSITIKAGDSIRIVYSAPYHDEVRTRFTGSPSISSLTLDEEHTSGTRTFSTAGTWTFKADDHSGNTGTIVVK